jgi:hypothetical protein
MPKEGIFAQVSDELRWGVKRAAVEERTTVKDLVTRILANWLSERGYAGGGTGDE